VVALLLMVVATVSLWVAKPVGSLQEDVTVPHNPNGLSLPAQPYCKVPR
jgi:hypothetical protein